MRDVQDVHGGLTCGTYMTYTVDRHAGRTGRTRWTDVRDVHDVHGGPTWETYMVGRTYMAYTSGRTYTADGRTYTLADDPRSEGSDSRNKIDRWKWALVMWLMGR